MAPMAPLLSLSLSLLLLSLLPPPSLSTSLQCQDDCSQPPSLRLLGPTRPSSPSDPIGNTLSLTRPHPYFHAPAAAAVVRFNHTLRLHLPAYQTPDQQSGACCDGTPPPIPPLTVFHKRYLLKALQKVAGTFLSDDVVLLEAGAPVKEVGTGGVDYWADVLYSSE